jgi:hypothetical protein
MLRETTNSRPIFRLAMASRALFGVLGMVRPPTTFSEDVLLSKAVPVSVTLPTVSRAGAPVESPEARPT